MTVDKTELKTFQPASRSCHRGWGIALGLTALALPIAVPAPASALSFSFSFSNPGEEPLTGLISGLLDNTDSQSAPPVSVSITSGPAESIGTYTLTPVVSVGGFSTSNGDVILRQIPNLLSGTRVWQGSLPSPALGVAPVGFLSFFRVTADEVLVLDTIGANTIRGAWSPVPPSRLNPEPEGLIAGSVTFQRVEDVNPNEVPGPLPVFGAIAAFGYGRKLRQRIQQERK